MSLRRICRFNREPRYPPSLGSTCDEKTCALHVNNPFFGRDSSLMAACRVLGKRSNENIGSEQPLRNGQTRVCGSIHMLTRYLRKT